MERNWDSLLSCFFLLCYENRELWEARVRHKTRREMCWRARSGSKHREHGATRLTGQSRERGEINQILGTEEYWLASQCSDLVSGNDVIIRAVLQSVPLFMWSDHYLGRGWCLDSPLSPCHPSSATDSQIQSTEATFRTDTIRNTIPGREECVYKV